MSIHLLLPFIHGYKILYAVPKSGKSHWVYGQNFVEALLDKGHEVTAITNYAFHNQSHQNYTEVLIKDAFDHASLGIFRLFLSSMIYFDQFYNFEVFFPPNFPANNRNSMSRLFESPFLSTFLIPIFSSISADHAFSDANVQKLIHDKNAHFDLIINHEIFHDSFLVLGHRFNAPVVGICTYLNWNILSSYPIMFTLFLYFRSIRSVRCI